MAVLGLRFCARAFSSCGERGPLFIAVRGPLTIAASLVAEHRLQTRRLSSCGARAQLLRGMWDLPRPGLEPVSPALAGRFSTTAPPGKPSSYFKGLVCKMKTGAYNQKGMSGDTTILQKNTRMVKAQNDLSLGKKIVHTHTHTHTQGSFYLYYNKNKERIAAKS